MTVQIEQIGRRLIVDGQMLQFNASASRPPIIGKHFICCHGDIGLYCDLLKTIESNKAAPAHWKSLHRNLGPYRPARAFWNKLKTALWRALI